MLFEVFIDTAIYQDSNFSFSNNKFSKLKKLVEDGVVLLLFNEIVYQEVKQHICDYIKEAASEYNNTLSNKGFAPFKYSTNWKSHLEVLDITLMSKEQIDNWDNYLKDCLATDITLNNININSIIEKYFKKQLPFENKKPNEFKDAITIESIKEYFANEQKEKLYVISSDKGFRKSFRDDKNIITFDSINKFLNFVILQTEIWANAVNNAINEEDFSDYISDNLDVLADKNHIDLDYCYDDFEIVSTEYIEYELGYIDILDKEHAEVTLEVTVQICVEYTEVDEENSYYDDLKGGYMWENFIKYQDIHQVTFDVVLSLGILGLDEHEVKEEINKHLELIQDFDETILGISLELENISISDNAFISLSHKTQTDSEIVEQTAHNNDDEENGEYTFDPYYGKPYTSCPDCGKPISHENDGGNGFCTDCAPEH